MALIVVQTLWIVGPLRCVLMKHAPPTTYVVEVFNGCRVLDMALADDPVQAQPVATHFRKRFRRSSPPISSGMT